MKSFKHSAAMLAFASLAGAAGQAMAATADFTLYQSDDPIVVFGGHAGVSAMKKGRR